MKNVELWQVVTNSGSTVVAAQLPETKGETGEAWNAKTGEPIEYGGGGDVVAFLIATHRPFLLLLDRLSTSPSAAIISWTLYQIGWRLQPNGLWRFSAEDQSFETTAAEALALEKELPER